MKRSHYRILGLIGQGQFGQVFCAVHRQTGRLVALKNLDHQRFPTHRFLRELRFLLSLQHPNIVTCQALEHTPTGRALVMDYCEAGPLRSLMREDYRPSLPQSLKLIADALAGLEHAHSRQIIHCDIKPENILLHVHAEGWTARISDFGIARLCQEDEQCELGNTGSPAYMAPERFYGHYSPASDLYSIGILLFELLAGYRPFSGTPTELMSAHLNLPLKIPDSVPKPWQPLLIQALQKLPARRFDSAREMRSMLHAIAAATGIDVRETGSQTLQRTAPLFLPVEHPPVCSFQFQYQEPLAAPLQQLAVSRAATPRVYGATARQVGWQSLAPPLPRSERASLPLLRPSSSLRYLAPLPFPIEAVWARPQGCFIATRRAAYWLPEGLPEVLHSDPPVPLWEFATDSLSTIDARGHWFATLTLPDPASLPQLAFWALPKAAPRGLTAQPLPLSLPDTPPVTSRLLALDGGHVALVMPLAESPLLPQLSASSTGPNGNPAKTLIHVVPRRGSHVGSLLLPLRLGRCVLTSTPYRLLAIDADHPQALLLVDLKPYRVTRLWIGMAPSLLVTTDWSYIVASTHGEIRVLDHSGRIVGEISIPETITAMASLPPYGLLVATWRNPGGSLYWLDLSQIGIDLVF